MALTPVEAVEAVGECGHRAQAAYGYHGILASLAKELFLEAFLIAVDTGAKAFNDRGLRWFKRYFWSHRARSRHVWVNRQPEKMGIVNSASC